LGDGNPSKVTVLKNRPAAETRAAKALGPGMGTTSKPFLPGLGSNQDAWVAEAGSTRIGAVGYIPAFGQQPQYPGRTTLLIMGVAGYQGLSYAQMVEQFQGVAGILAGYDINLAEDCGPPAG
jgi:hypothetical protein